jgi:hypothetical protein
MRKTTLGALVAGVTLALAPAAHAQDESAMQFDFLTAKKNTSTGFAMAYVREGEGKPKRALGMKLTLPGGSKIIPAAAPVCTADIDKRFDEGHKTHCPANTQVGEGDAQAYAGNMLVDDRIEFWNVRGERSALNAENYVNNNRLYAFSGLYKGRSIDFDFNGYQGIAEFSMGVERHTKRINGKRRGYITTPKKCPRNKKWKVSLTIRYQDGTTQKLKDTTRCKR